MNTKVLGASGEVRASNFLEKKGYKILQKNYASKIGEIDLIAMQNKTIVFVEVKMRSSKLFGRPCEAVNYSKQQKIRKVALGFLKQTKNLETPCRFDVIEIIGEKIRHIENAF